MTHDEAMEIIKGGAGYTVATIIAQSNKIKELQGKLEYLENHIEENESKLEAEYNALRSPSKSMVDTMAEHLGMMCFTCRHRESNGTCSKLGINLGDKSWCKKWEHV